MPLYISQHAQTFPATTGLAVANIAGGVGVVGGQPVPNDPTVVRVVYQSAGGGFGQNFLDMIVNHTAPNPIVLFGVSDTFVLPNGTPITSEFGWTTWPSLPNLPSAGEVIRMFVDVTECSGVKYCVCAAGGNPTAFPVHALLVHELSHARQAVDGTFNLANTEPLAIADENGYRSQRAILPLRDPTLYGDPSCTGCGKCP